MATDRRKCLWHAEDQPFENETFDLVTVSSGVHWFDIDKFLPEARRILKTQSWLVLYENYINPAIEGAEGFAAWFADSYLREFPIIAKVEGGKFSYGEVQTWLHNELTPFFPADEDAPRAVSYGNWIKFIQRMD